MNSHNEKKTTSDLSKIILAFTRQCVPSFIQSFLTFQIPWVLWSRDRYCKGAAQLSQSSRERLRQSTLLVSNFSGNEYERKCISYFWLRIWQTNGFFLWYRINFKIRLWTIFWISVESCLTENYIQHTTRFPFRDKKKVHVFDFEQNLNYYLLKCVIATIRV